MGSQTSQPVPKKKSKWNTYAEQNLAVGEEMAIKNKKRGPLEIEIPCDCDAGEIKFLDGEVEDFKSAVICKKCHRKTDGSGDCLYKSPRERSRSESAIAAYL